jgi:hypothetical protein
MLHPPHSRRPLLLGAFAFLPLIGIAAGCGPSLRSLARDTFFHSYDCPKGEVEVTGGGDNVPYQATGCGKRASYVCRSESGSLGCQEVGAASPPAASPVTPSATAAAPSATPPAQP